MTTKTTVAPGNTFTVPSGITKMFATAQGAAGATRGTGTAGRGAIVRSMLAVAPTNTFAVASIPGGTGGIGLANGGAGLAIGSSVIAGGGGATSEMSPTNVPTLNGGDAGLASGADGQGVPDGNAWSDGGHGGSGSTGGAAGSTSVANVGGYTSGTAGKDHSAGGAGGNGGAPQTSGDQGHGGGAGGGGYAGGGGGTGGKSDAATFGPFNGGGGAGGSSFADELIGYNATSTVQAVFEHAATPLTPALIGPSGSQMIDRSIDQALTWQPNPASADVLDAIVSNDVRYRKVGAATWVTTSVGAQGAYTIVAGTLEAGAQYEWQARSTADGLIGPWSTSSYFTADNPATAPTITDPASGSVVAVNSVTAAWTVTTQTSYQMRVVGDNAGSPDAGAIYADSGEQISADRTKTLTVNANHVSAHVQVRVRDKTSGVWSAWASVAVTIEWDGPPKPRVTLATDIRSIHVTITNPAPVGVEPVADRIEVYVIEGETRERRAILAPGDGWVYETPPSGVDVGIEAVAIYTPTNVQTSSGVIY